MAVRHALFKIYKYKGILSNSSNLHTLELALFAQLIDTEHRIIRNYLFSVPFFLQHFAAFTCGPIDEGAKSK